MTLLDKQNLKDLQLDDAKQQIALNFFYFFKQILVTQVP